MRFDVILADPAWSFQTWSDKGKDRSPENHYRTMTIEDICQLPVGEIASPDAVLFLWVTFPTLFAYAPRVIEAWGFEYKTQAFTWVKKNRITDSWFFGNGYYTRANAEPCLLCVRKGGRAPVQDRGVSSLIVAPVGRHSEKPEETYNRIERLYPGGRKVELFARKRRAGWVSLGNEVNHGVDLMTSLDLIRLGVSVIGSEL